AAPAVAFVPWILFFQSRKRLTAAMLLLMAVVGFTAEISSFIRSHAGIGLILFALIIIARAYEVKKAVRGALIITLLTGAVGAALLFQHLYARRDAFLRATPGSIIKSTQGHVLWHPVYLGLGWVKNSEVPAYRDEVAFAKVKEIRPDVARY